MTSQFAGDNGIHAHRVRLTADGEGQLAGRQFGDIPAVTLDYRNVLLGGWTIEAREDFTRSPTTRHPPGMTLAATRATVLGCTMNRRPA